MTKKRPIFWSSKRHKKQARKKKCLPSSFESPQASLWPCANTFCVRGMASAPRLQALETRNLFHQETEKRKIVITKTSRYKGLVLGLFLVPKIDVIFCSRPLLLTRCWFDAFLHWNSAAEEGAWVGLKPNLQGGTGFNLLRVQF